MSETIDEWKDRMGKIIGSMKDEQNKHFNGIVEEICELIFRLQFSGVPNKTKNSIVDRYCRTVSDYLGCEKTDVTHSTYFILKNCKMWSVEAIKLYKKMEGNHAARCSSKKQGGTKFIVEHEYPLGIVKKKVQNKEFKTVSAVVKYMRAYAIPVIVTVDEDERLRVLQRTAETLKEAEDRYKKAKIVVKRFEDWAK